MANLREPLLTARDLELLLELLLGHTKPHLAQLLRSKGIPYTGTKERQRERVEQGIQEGTIFDEELVALLDDIEGWGNQHIYLYELTPAALEPLRDYNVVQQRFAANDFQGLYNNDVTVFIPEQPTMVSSTHDNESLRLKFVEERRWSELVEQEVEDHPDFGELDVRKYRRRRGRGINSVRVHLATGQTDVMIQTLQSGTDYDRILDRFLDEFDWLIPRAALTLIQTGTAIPAIEATDEIRRRASVLGTLGGSVTSFKSSRSLVDYRDDQDLSNAREALGNHVVGHLGNFYWLVTHPGLEREVHTHIHKDRVGFLGERTEPEINYVLSRIRSYCR